jgi:6-phosphogluconolactonase (cycloisomerase 2 family)
MDPLGRFLFVLDVVEGILTFSIDPTTGALSPLPGTAQPSGIPLTPPAIDPSGKFLYFVSQNSSGIGIGLSGYAIDASTGAVTPVAGSPFALPATAGTPILLTVTRKTQ